MVFEKIRYKKMISLFLVVTVLLSHAVVYARQAYVWPDPKADAELSFTEDANQAIIKEDRIPTGLSFEFTYTDKSISSMGVEKYWLDMKKPAKGEMLLEESQEMVSIDFSKFDNTFISCIADHIEGPENATRAYGAQVALTGVYMPTENMGDYPDMIQRSCGGKEDGLDRARFNLLFVSLIHGKLGATSDSDITDSMNSTGHAALMYCTVRAIDGNPGFNGNSYTEDWDLMMANGSSNEIRKGYKPDKNGKNGIWDEFEATKEDYFKKCWEEAKFLSYFKYTANSVNMPLTPAEVGADGLYHRSLDFSTFHPAAISYFQKLELKNDVSGLTFIKDNNKIDFSAVSAEALETALKDVILKLDGGDVTIAPSGLCGFKYIVMPIDGNGVTQPGEATAVGQTRFAAYQAELSIRAGDYVGEGDGGGGGDPTLIPGSFYIEIHRYNHSENWNSHYNINLHKYDSETGKPLEGASFDILEAFDDSQIQELDSKENWANESGSQFMKWNDWDYGPGYQSGDAGNDACEMDTDKTNEDGILTNRGNGDPAHYDEKSYTYNKGFCGGHPDPVIEYYEIDGDADEEAQAEVDALNAQLEIDAWKAWQDEIDICVDLVGESGYYHSIAEGEAQKELESDRDQYYEEFISLKYEYSAKELNARPGYILHDIHKDDILVETKTVTSSEYKDLVGNKGNSIPHVESSGGGSGDSDKRAAYSIPGVQRGMPATASDAEYTGAVSEIRNVAPGSTFTFATASDAQEMDEDGIIIEDLIITDSSGIFASPSTAMPSESGKDTGEGGDTSFLENLFESVKTFFTWVYEGVVSLFDNGRAADVKADSKRDKVTEASIANRVGEMDKTIVDHTFILFDHRTEGEIHINKRDLNLDKNAAAQYNPYGGENADGTLEGAVYGLFAAQDIVHPDGKTGVVYQKGNLVSLATTDRDGNASFMAFTEAPGKVYSYETGAVEEAPGGWAQAAPKNLHLSKDEGDGFTKDNETYIGTDSENNEQSIADSMEGDNTVYHKMSSNQDGLQGITGSFATYPIHNNAANNGNCWIGRPLIAQIDGSQYLVKELSRSEGYELSISGKDNTFTNGKNSYETMAKTPTVSISALTYDNAKAALYATLTASDVGTELHLEGQGMKEGAAFATSAYKDVAENVKVMYQEEVIKPVIGTKDSYVYLDSKRIEAKLGDAVVVNGISYPVNNVSTEQPGRLGVMPKNFISFGTPKVTTVGAADFEDFKNKYNDKLKTTGYKEALSTSPWAKVQLTGANDTAWITCVTKYMTDHNLIYFNRLRIREIVQEGGRTYAMLAFDYTFDGSSFDNAIYNPDKGEIYVRKNTGNGYDVFVTYGENDAAVTNVVKNGSGFLTSASIKNQQVTCNVMYPADLPDSFTMVDAAPKSYWLYDGIQQRFNNDGSLETRKELVTKYRDEIVTVKKEVLTPLTSVYDNGFYQVTVPESAFADGDTITIKVCDAGEGKFNPYLGGKLVYKPGGTTDTYTKTAVLTYPGQNTVIQDVGTIERPLGVLERPIRQKVKVSKDIQTLDTPKVVWYCLNCGYETQDGILACGFCGIGRTVEETKTIRYAHDTYSAVHAENISADRNGGVYDKTTDWLTSLLRGDEPQDSAADIPNFRFKAYLKSNLERLYRDVDGEIIWTDRNGNTMAPQYEDMNGDGNYDTFIWKYDTAYAGVETDFPEKDIVSADGKLESSNVQKIFTKVLHNTDSKTASAQANNVWDDYDSPQMSGNTENVGEKEGFSTSLREKQGGGPGDLSGKAVDTSSALYSYVGKNIDVAQSDKIKETQNIGITRLLETRKTTMEDGDTTREVETYNYEKFFDAINAANTDIWDDDMHSTFTGSAMNNYPGQHWFDTFYEAYQKDDADPNHILANTDGADTDGTAGGDRDTSFKPFRWIRENAFGNHTDYEKDPAEHNGVNTETTMSTSNFAKANAEASDAVREFATKWYLEDEAGKLMTNNGVGEDIGKADGGSLDYDEAVYDEALFHAIAKTYNYLKPFYQYDLDTVYSVEWDSEAAGGADGDYTTLSIDNDGGEEYYSISSYLPYGTYIVVEQRPGRVDEVVNDFRNRSYTIEKPKELLVPSVYDGPASNSTTDNFDGHYYFDYGLPLQEQAKKDNYLIRFGEEWPHNNNQDEREYVIRAHGWNGDFEIYKYGLDIDRLTGKIAYGGGDYTYAGFKISQGEYDPLKDYYDTRHRGAAGIAEIGTENGGEDNSHYHASDETNGKAAANGGTYDGDALAKRFFYASITEDAGIADNVLFGAAWNDNVRAVTGELTAYEGGYAHMLVPWSVTIPADMAQYSGKDFSGYADTNMRDGFFTAKLKINKVDSESGEYILHDNAIFALYAGSRYTSFDEIKKDAGLIGDADERQKFLKQFKPGDAKFYLKDTVITGTKEYLDAMRATEITKAGRKRSVIETAAGAGEMYTGMVKKGTPICMEGEKIMLHDGDGERTGQMTVYTTLNDVLVSGEENADDKEYANQNTGYFVTLQPVGAGVYVLAELKPPAGYVRSAPVAYEVYSDKTQYYVDGDMYSKVTAVRSN